MAIQSGHSSTFTFGTTTTFLPAMTTIGGFEATRESLDTSGLATTGARTKIGGDLYEIGPNTHSYLLDPDTLAAGEANSIDDLLFDSNAASASEAMTILLDNAGASTIAGDGHVTGWSLEDLTTDAIIACTLTTQWDAWPTITE